MQKAAIFGGVAAVAVTIGVVLAFTSIPPENEKSVSNFPIKVDFARIIPYENSTDYPMVSRGHIMHIRLLYPEEGPPRPFYLLFSPESYVLDEVTDAEQWVKEGVHGNHGFEVLSSSKEFDLFTEFFPFDSSIIPLEMRLYCPDCEEQWSERHIVWHGVDERITKIKGLIVHAGDPFYEVGFALGNDQIDTLPASGTVEFVITDSLGVRLYANVFKAKNTDFRGTDDPIRYLRVPMGGKASYIFTIPSDQIKSSPTGKTTGFAMINFVMEDGRVLSGGTRGVQLPIR
ncbi:MAG: hypothetical protein ACE5KA_08700 [Nitrososphaerales archaeon]